MKTVKQFILYRESYTVDEGTMGFHDYVTRKEKFIDFVERVNNKANELCTNQNTYLNNISYPSEDISIIVYTEFTEDK